MTGPQPGHDQVRRRGDPRIYSEGNEPGGAARAGPRNDHSFLRRRQSTATRSRAPSSMALVLIGPATVFVPQLVVPLAILFRYSLNRFDPAAYMVDAVTAENYVKFFADPYYLAVLGPSASRSSRRSSAS